MPRAFDILRRQVEVEVVATLELGNLEYILAIIERFFVVVSYVIWRPV